MLFLSFPFPTDEEEGQSMENALLHCVTNALTTMVVERKTGRSLGGFGSNFYRSWVFPLYTPNGHTVLQEFAHDHPFHNGIFVGQHPISARGKIANYWVTPPKRMMNDPVYTRLGRVDAPEMPEAEIFADRVRFTLRSVWRDEQEEPVLAEIRTVDFSMLEDATVCEMTSRKIAAYGPLDIQKTKYGSIGIRVEPRLLASFGGAVLADGNRLGKAADLNLQDSDFIAYENALDEKTRCGVFLCIPAGERGPWFIRDYGMALYNPTARESVQVAEGEEWSVSLRVVAYDNRLTPERINRFLHRGK